MGAARRERACRTRRRTPCEPAGMGRHGFSAREGCRRMARTRRRRWQRHRTSGVRTGLYGDPRTVPRAARRFDADAGRHGRRAQPWRGVLRAGREAARRRRKRPVGTACRPGLRRAIGARNAVVRGMGLARSVAAGDHARCARPCNASHTASAGLAIRPRPAARRTRTSPACRRPASGRRSAASPAIGVGLRSVSSR